ncbi:MAG: Uma2 family endonuclease [Gemmataceae bacterium]
MSSISELPIGMPPGPVWKFTVEQYHQMINSGTLTENDPVELIEGWILPKMPQSPDHMTAIGLLDDMLREQLPDDWHVRTQGPITTSDSEPEPDLVVARGKRLEFARRHPGPGDIGLVAEVSNSSLAFDRTTKARVYARAGIASYWILNADQRTVEVFTDPDSTSAHPNYRNHNVYPRGETVGLTVDGRKLASIEISSLFPL